MIERTENRLTRTLSAIRQAGGKALIPFLVAGYPDQALSLQLADTLLQHGADVLELGVPFSDPAADGPVIQSASAAALAGGTSTDHVFEMAATLRLRHDKPLVLLLYANTLFHRGIGRFFDDCRKSGIDAVIIPDLPLEEQTAIQPIAASSGVLIIRMVTPLSGNRLPALLDQAEGFIYCVAALGTTGERQTFSGDLTSYARQLASLTRVPRALGFGISTPEQIRALAPDWDALIVGSALVRRIGAWHEGGDCCDLICGKARSYMHSLREACDHIFAGKGGSDR